MKGLFKDKQNVMYVTLHSLPFYFYVVTSVEFQAH